MAMGPLEQRLTDLIDPTVTSLGCELLGLEFAGQGQHSRLRLFIDRDGGVTVDDCERVSRQVSAVLDVEDPIRGHYALEVSSPGLDRPLFKPEHFARFIGHVVKVRVRHALAGQRNFKGRIVGLQDGTLRLETDEAQPLDLALVNVEKANLVPEI